MIILDTRFIPPCKLCQGEAALELPDFPIEEDQAEIRVACGQCGAAGPAVIFDLSVHDNNDLPGLQIEALSAWCNHPTRKPGRAPDHRRPPDRRPGQDRAGRGDYLRLPHDPHGGRSCGAAHPVQAHGSGSLHRFLGQAGRGIE